MTAVEVATEEIVAPFPALPMDATCGWCNIRLRAIPDQPRPYAPKDCGGEIHYYHPGCVAAARNADAGIRREPLPGSIIL